MVRAASEKQNRLEAADATAAALLQQLSSQPGAGGGAVLATNKLMCLYIRDNSFHPPPPPHLYQPLGIAQFFYSFFREKNEKILSNNRKPVI